MCNAIYKFSIIIPVYNVDPYLRECLDSVLSQTFSDWEAICVDDGSTDGSGAILDEYAEKDARFRVIHQKNAGVSAARNVALDCARGEWIGFLDADDVWASIALQSTVGVLKKYPDEALVRFKYKEFQETEKCNFGRNLEIGSVSRIVIDKEIHIQDFYCYFITFFLNREFFKEVRFPLYKRGEDRVYIDRILLSCVKGIVSLDATFYGYRQRRSSQMHSKPSVQVLLDEMDHRCDVIEMCDKSDKLVRYEESPGWEWLERYLTSSFVDILLGCESHDRKLLIDMWYARLLRIKQAKRITSWGRFLIFVYTKLCWRNLHLIHLVHWLDMKTERFYVLIRTNGFYRKSNNWNSV